MTHVKRIKHNSNINMTKASVDHVAWIRSRSISIPSDIYEQEVDGFPDGLVDIVMTFCAIESPGNPPMFGIGARFVDTTDDEDREEVSGTVYYWSASEIGSALVDKAYHTETYFEDEEVVSPPPKWLGLPWDDDEVEMDQHTAQGTEQKPEPSGQGQEETGSPGEESLQA